MKSILSKLSLARAAIVGSVALSSPSVFAAGAVTTYSNDDLFIGFRQTGVANTLAVNLGAATQFIPSTIAGGTASPGSTFNVGFGVIPAGETNAGTSVQNLFADLKAVFGDNWFSNNTVDSGVDVSWAVAGITANLADNTPINGLNRKSSFLTLARVDPATVAGAPANFSISSFGGAFNSFAVGGPGGNSYAGRISTLNSSKAYIGAGTDSNNWGTRIGPVGSTFGSGVLGEQPLSGANSGPTNSFLDLYVFPSDGSTLLTTPTYLGTFSLNTSGVLQYKVVPEPGSAVLLGLGVAMLGGRRRRHRSNREPVASAAVH